MAGTRTDASGANVGASGTRPVCPGGRSASIVAKRKPAPPPVLPGYTFVRPLGSGGFADVYLYEQDMPRRVVAVKVSSTTPSTPKCSAPSTRRPTSWRASARTPRSSRSFRLDLCRRAPVLRHGVLPRQHGARYKKCPLPLPRCSTWACASPPRSKPPTDRSAAQRHQAVEHSRDDARHARARGLRHRGRGHPDR